VACVDDAGTWPTILQIREACAKSRKTGMSGLQDMLVELRRNYAAVLLGFTTSNLRRPAAP